MMRQRDEVYEKLETVYDPELDESVTEMGFIEDIKIEGSGMVTVHFQLPTYWCSPNFAFIMAEDIRTEVMKLDWVTGVKVELKDHCASDEINEGVSSGKSFMETFEGKTNGELDELRQIFRVKTFRSRQERVLRHLLNSGLSETSILKLSVEELMRHPLVKNIDSTNVEKYLKVRSEFDQGVKLSDPAFVSVDGDIIRPEAFKDYMLESRRTRMSMEFNSNYCRGLLQTRYGKEMKEKETEGVKQ